jgi:hypothetical protein
MDIFDGFVDRREPSQETKDQYPWLPKEEQLKIQDRVDRYLNLAWDIYRDVKERPGGLAGLELLLADRRKELKAEDDRQVAIERPCSLTRPWLERA